MAREESVRDVAIFLIGVEKRYVTPVRSPMFTSASTTYVDVVSEFPSKLAAMQARH